MEGLARVRYCEVCGDVITPLDDEAVWFNHKDDRRKCFNCWQSHLFVSGTAYARRRS